MDLGDRVLGSAPRAEAIGHGLKSASKIGSSTSFNDGLHDPVSGGRDPEAAELARSPWGSPSPAPGAGRTGGP